MKLCGVWFDVYTYTYSAGGEFIDYVRVNAKLIYE